jgi:hypothetical protein
MIVYYLDLYLVVRIAESFFHSMHGPTLEMVDHLLLQLLHPRRLRTQLALEMVAPPPLFEVIHAVGEGERHLLTVRVLSSELARERSGAYLSYTSHRRRFDRSEIRGP